MYSEEAALDHLVSFFMRRFDIDIRPEEDFKLLKGN